MSRPLTLIGAVLLACASLSLHGCGSGGGGNNITVSDDGNNITTVGGGNAKMVINGVTVEIKDGRIWVDGKDRGPIQKGDSVVLKADGKVYVNNEKR
jgi:hypothetical protein